MNSTDDDLVVVVDVFDHPIGNMSKFAAHTAGELHRAFSVFLFNEKGEYLLQRRAFDKYHSGGLWSNTCCSHPKPGESIEVAARRRLQEEMGLECEVDPLFEFVYRAELDGGMIEHEFDHVLVGQTSGRPIVNPKEVADYKFASESEIRKQLLSNPTSFTEWFRICFDRVANSYIDKNYLNLTP